MENLAEKFLLKITDQIVPHIENTAYGPFFMENLKIWATIIDVNKPSFGSLKFTLSQKQDKQYSNLTFEFYSEENHELLLQIFKKTANLLNTMEYGIYQTEGCLTLDWQLDLNNDKEIFLFLNKTFIFFQKFFVLIKDLGLIKLKKTTT